MCDGRQGGFDRPPEVLQGAGHRAHHARRGVQVFVEAADSVRVSGTSLASRGSGDLDGLKEAVFVFLAQGA